MRTTATGLSGSNGNVWEVASVLASVCARGEGEGRSATMGQGDALARSGACPCARWRHRLTRARPVLVNVGLSLVEGLHQQVQESKGRLKDMVM
jgi:hypothetical protein